MNDTREVSVPHGGDGWDLGDLRWQLRDDGHGGVLIYALVQTGWRRGSPLFENAITLRIDLGTDRTGAKPEHASDLGHAIADFLVRKIEANPAEDPDRARDPGARAI